MLRKKSHRTQLYWNQPVPSLLGEFKLAGFIRDSHGLPPGKMRVLGSYALVYLLEGGGLYKDASGLRRPVKAGDLIWVFPDLPHHYGPVRNSPWDEIFIIFDGPLARLWEKEKLLQASQPIWSLAPVAFWHKQIEATIHSSQPPGWETSLQQMNRLQQVLLDMHLALRHGSGPDPERRRLQRAARLLEQITPPDWDRLSAAAGMSYESFRKKFSTHFGLSPAQYHQAWLTEKAGALLLEPELTTKDIATRLGFCDEFHFSKVFKKRMAMSPRVFRQNALGRHAGH
jgi:AraC-like DNA-binding protein